MDMDASGPMHGTMVGVSDLQHYLGFGLGLLTLTAITLALARWAGVGLGLFPLWAILRAIAQLTVVALLLRGILAVPWSVALFLVLVLTTVVSEAGHEVAVCEEEAAARSLAADVLVLIGRIGS